jgi:hypothetical protein
MLWDIPVSETLPFSPKIRHRISHTHQIAAAPPRRLAAPFPNGSPTFHQIAGVARRIAPARQHFEVVRRAGLSRSASNLDLAQEVFGASNHKGGCSVVLEAVADQDLWIWHAFFGMAGSHNDINVL